MPRGAMPLGYLEKRAVSGASNHFEERVRTSRDEGTSRRVSRAKGKSIELGKATHGS